MDQKGGNLGGKKANRYTITLCRLAKRKKRWWFRKEPSTIQDGPNLPTTTNSLGNQKKSIEGKKNGFWGVKQVGGHQGRPSQQGVLEIQTKSQGQGLSYQDAINRKKGGWEQIFERSKNTTPRGWTGPR